VAGAAKLVAPKPPPVEKRTATGLTSSGSQESDDLPLIPAAAVTVAAIGVVYLLFRWVRRRRSY
jgi:hypothetical protein